jgi:hypothetical protein
MTDMISVSGAYITRDGHGVRLAKSIEKADILNLNVGGKNATLIKDKSLPLVNEGDDVEVTGVVNSKSGWLEVFVLKNSTSSAEWKLSRARVMFGFLKNQENFLQCPLCRNARLARILQGCCRNLIHDYQKTFVSYPR